MRVYVSHFHFFVKVMQNSDEEEEEENSEDQTIFEAEILLKLLLCYTLLIQGLYRYLPGPILNDLSIELQEKITPVVFTLRGTAGVVGVVLGSIIHQYLMHSNQKILILFLSSFLMSVTAFGTAMSKSFAGIKVAFAGAGFCLGAIVSGVNALYLHTKTIPTKTLCLTLSLFYATGALIAPMITRQYFLYKGDTVVKNISITDNGSRIYSRRRPEMISPMEHVELIFRTFPIPFTTVSYSYVIASFMIFIESLFWLGRYCVTASTVVQAPTKDDEEEYRVFKNLTILIGSLTSFISESIVFSYVVLLPVIYSACCTQSARQTSELMAFFLGCVCMSRVMALLISWKIKPHNIRILGVTFVLAGCIILYIYESDDATHYWIANGFIGFGAGPLFGSAQTWIADKYHVKHLYIMPYYVMSCFVEMVMPWAFSLTAYHDYPKVKLIILILSILYIILLMFDHFIIYEIKKRRKKIEKREKEILFLAERLPIILRKRSSDASGQEKLETQQEQKPEPNLHEVLNRMSELKRRLNHNNEDVKQTLNQLRYSVVSK